MKPKASPAAFLIAGAFVFYPALVYFALQRFPLRVVALIVLSLGAIRLLVWRFTGHQFGGLWLAVAAAAGAGLSLVANSQIGIKLYPVLVNAIMLGLFAFSLIRPPSVIERVARLKEPDLGPEGVAYTRKVTAVWCLFFAVNGSVATLTVFLSERVWALYNGVIAYIAMGLLFAVEFWLRPKHTRS